MFIKILLSFQIQSEFIANVTKYIYTKNSINHPAGLPINFLSIGFLSAHPNIIELLEVVFLAAYTYCQLKKNRRHLVNNY